MPPKLTPEHYRQLAAKRGYEWLGTEVTTNRAKQPWRCSKGHEWMMPYDNLQQGQSCPACSKEHAAEIRRHKPDAYEALAAERGFNWTGSLPKNSKTPTEWSCALGHSWKTSYESTREGAGCPICLKLTIHERHVAAMPYRDGLKQCYICGEYKSPTKEFFNLKSTSPDGLTGDCRDCHNKRVEKRNRAKGVQAKPTIRKDGMKRCYKCQQWKPETEDYFVRSSYSAGGFAGRCKACDRAWKEEHGDYLQAYHQAYRTDPDNREKARLKTKEWRDADPARAYAATRRWHLAHPESSRRSIQKWAKNNPAKVRAVVLRRRARQRNLPDTFTSADWLRALDYFHGCCAVCGRQLYDLLGEHKAHADHWIPLASPDCPGTIPENIVPLCGGKGGCNTSKVNLPAEVWLLKHHSKAKTKVILARVEAYFRWLRD